MLLVALGFMTVGYTLLYAGIKGGPKNEWAYQPWQLWVQAFQQLGREASAAQAAGGQFIGSLRGPRASGGIGSPLLPGTGTGPAGASTPGA